MQRLSCKHESGVGQKQSLESTYSSATRLVVQVRVSQSQGKRTIQ